MSDIDEIGLVLGVIVGSALALQTALGPVMTTIVDALSATQRIRSGWAGVASLGIGTLLGAVIGLMAWHASGDLWWLLTGAFAGLCVGAGGVTSHQRRVGAAELLKKRNTQRRGSRSESPPAQPTRTMCGGPPDVMPPPAVTPFPRG